MTDQILFEEVRKILELDLKSSYFFSKTSFTDSQKKLASYFFHIKYLVYKNRLAIKSQILSKYTKEKDIKKLKIFTQRCLSGKNLCKEKVNKILKEFESSVIAYHYGQIAFLEEAFSSNLNFYMFENKEYKYLILKKND